MLLPNSKWIKSLVRYLADVKSVHGVVQSLSKDSKIPLFGIWVEGDAAFFNS